MTIDIEGIPGNRALRTRVMGRLRKVLDRLVPDSASALVNFEDVNGPKGGADMRCGITIAMPPRRSVHAEATATAAPLAFSSAVDALERQLKRLAERAQDRRRRPKKYYVARRLLLPEPGPGVPGEPRRRAV